MPLELGGNPSGVVGISEASDPVGGDGKLHAATGAAAPNSHGNRDVGLPAGGELRGWPFRRSETKSSTIAGLRRGTRCLPQAPSANRLERASYSSLIHGLWGRKSLASFIKERASLKFGLSPRTIFCA